MSKILFNLSGSIACFKAAQAISDLVKLGYEVQTVATPSALEFVGEATLEGLTGRAVFKNNFQPGQAMDHIHWARWADLSILCPASASCINSLAAGLAQDTVGSLFMAHDLSRGTYWVAPAMNTTMLHHPATQASLAEIKNWGVRILMGEDGPLACKESGPGRLIEPKDLVREVGDFFKHPPKKHFVVTSGGTREYLDPVRCLTNVSSGSTGTTIAEQLLARGHQVSFLAGQDSRRPAHNPHLTIESFVSAADLGHRLHALLQNPEIDAVIHAAAVSDYSIREPSPMKLKSGMPLTLSLAPTEKIVNQIRTWAKNPKIKLVAFKLTHETPREERVAQSRALLTNSRADLVITNDWSEISKDSHPAMGIGLSGTIFTTQSKSELAREICKAVEA